VLALPDSPARLDPSRPLRIGEENYPPESRRLREQGKCVVQVKVDKWGNISDPKIIVSAGYDRLDAACIAATTSGHLLPAVKGGTDVDSVTEIPIVWKLKAPVTLSDCMAVPERLSLAEAAAALRAKSTHKVVEGRTELRVFVAETGEILGAKVDKSSGNEHLDEASLRGVAGQKMVPATVDGQPTAACVTLPIVWKLK
jgi:TonB family protein